MTFDGPGQQAPLLEQGLVLRPDWENVLRPVLDAMLTRRDVASDRVAVIGVNQAGYGVVRALAFEHRFPAAVCEPGVVDVSTSWTDTLPPSMRQRLDDGDRAGFDREMHLADLFTLALGVTLRSQGRPYGLVDGSRFELYQAVREYRLGPETARITTPLLITDSGGERSWPDQSRQLFDRLAGGRELTTFTAWEGADRHRATLGSAARETRIFDWLDHHVQGAERSDAQLSSARTSARRAEGPVAVQHQPRVVI